MKSIDALLATAPKSTTSVTVNGQTVELTPLSLMVIARLLRRFPVALKALMGEGGDILDTVVSCGPEALSAVIAAGLGEAGNLEAEAKIQTMPDELQLELLAEIMQATMPEGLESFLARLMPFIERIGLIANPAAATE